MRRTDSLQHVLLQPKRAAVFRQGRPAFGVAASLITGAERFTGDMIIRNAPQSFSFNIYNNTSKRLCQSFFASNRSGHNKNGRIFIFDFMIFFKVNLSNGVYIIVSKGKMLILFRKCRSRFCRTAPAPLLTFEKAVLEDGFSHFGIFTVFLPESHKNKCTITLLGICY